MLKQSHVEWNGIIQGPDDVVCVPYNNNSIFQFSTGLSGQSVLSFPSRCPPHGY